MLVNYYILNIFLDAECYQPLTAVMTSSIISSYDDTTTQGNVPTIRNGENTNQNQQCNNDLRYMCVKLILIIYQF